MQKTNWLCARVLPLLILCTGASLLAAGHASAGGEVDCTPAAQANYGIQRRIPNSLGNLPTILLAQQNLYSCHVKAHFPNLQQAVFLARVGQRVAHVAQDLISLSLSSCSSINGALTSTLNDINALQRIDSSPALGTLKAEVERLSDMSCARIIAQSYASDHFTDPVMRDFCAYKRTVEQLHDGAGSTSGFSSMIAPCYRFR